MTVTMPAPAPGTPDPLHPAELEFETELRRLFHRLNNQLGIILAHAELLEAKSADEISRARAEQVVTGTLDAMATAKAIRQITEPARL